MPVHQPGQDEAAAVIMHRRRGRRLAAADNAAMRSPAIATHPSGSTASGSTMSPRIRWSMRMFGRRLPRLWGR